MKIEHFALNVPEPAAMAAWYAENLGMRIVMASTTAPYMHFIADDVGSMIEIYNNPAAPMPDYPNMSPFNFHTAFTATDIEADRDRSSITAADAGYHAMAVVTKTDKSELQLFKEELILAQKIELQLFKDELLKREQATTPSRKEHPTFYCHSHGTTRNPNHTSKLCTNKKPGHKDSATLSNKMGGSTFVFGK